MTCALFALGFKSICRVSPTSFKGGKKTPAEETRVRISASETPARASENKSENMRERLGNASHTNVHIMGLRLTCVLSAARGGCSILIPPHAAEVQKKPAMTASYITFLLPLHGVLTEHPSTTIYSWASLGETLSLFTAAGVSLFAALARSVRRRAALWRAPFRLCCEKKRCGMCQTTLSRGSRLVIFTTRHKFFTPAILLRHFIDDFLRLTHREGEIKVCHANISAFNL